MNHENFNDKVRFIEDSVEYLSNQLKALLTNLKELQSSKIKLNDYTQTKLLTHLIFSISSMYSAYLQVRGIDTQNNPFINEFKRIQLLAEKISKTDTGTRTKKVNIEVLQRMLKHYIK